MKVWSKIGSALLVVFPPLASGCLPSFQPKPNAPGMSEYLERRLRDGYATSFGCPAEQVTLQLRGTVGPTWQDYRLSGCHKDEWRVLTTCEAQESCTQFANASMLLDRAAFDLECEKSKLTLTALGGLTFGVTGCEKRASYVSTGAAWVLNSETRPPGAK